MKPHHNERGAAELVIPIIGVLAVIAVIAWNLIYTNSWVNTKASQTCHVTNKESVTKDKTNQYRVYTDNCGVLQAKDEAWLGLWNSADTYNQIQTGETYAFQTVGWRNGFWSDFPNIVEVAAKQ